MANIITRTLGTTAKNAVLTNAELDNNFININNEIGTKLNKNTVEYQAFTTSLHKSPNVITAMEIYDTSKDSDGGAWTDKCSGTSWYNETLSGNWLGSKYSENDARCHNPVLGNNLVDTLNTVSGWDYVASGSSTITDDGINGIKIEYLTNTAPGAHLRALSGLSSDLVAGNLYEVTATAKVSTGSSVSIRIENTSSVPLSDLIAINTTEFTTIKLYFYATTTASNVLRVNGFGLGETVWVKDVMVKPVISTTTNVNDYFQLISDGKFYKLCRNILNYSQDFTNAYWTKFGLTVTPNAITAPDGTLTGSKIIPTSE